MVNLRVFSRSRPGMSLRVTRAGHPVYVIVIVVAVE